MTMFLTCFCCAFLIALCTILAIMGMMKALGVLLLCITVFIIGMMVGSILDD